MEVVISVIAGVAGLVAAFGAGLRVGERARGRRRRYWALNAAVLALGVALDALGLALGWWPIVVGALAGVVGALSGLKYGYRGAPVGMRPRGGSASDAAGDAGAGDAGAGDAVPTRRAP